MGFLRRNAMTIISLICVFAFLSVTSDVFLVGFAAHGTYEGFAEPIESYDIGSVDIGFSGDEDMVTVHVSVSDDAVYRYGYASYDGSGWTRFTLEGNVLGGDWLAGDSAAQLVMSPDLLGLGGERKSARDNFFVLYSCTRDNSGWDCHDGWQIVQFNATLEEAENLEVGNLTAQSQNGYEVSYYGLAEGAAAYTDRDFIFTDVPDGLSGLTYIKTANSDKPGTDNPFLSFDVNIPVTIYLAVDTRSVPSWLGEWNATGMQLQTDDTAFDIYAGYVDTGHVDIGGNEEVYSSMYIVVIDGGECTPDCTGKECGPDGCAGTCGPGCGGADTCDGGTCVPCQPDCSGKVCGDDSCGGVCPPGCTEPETCIAGQCTSGGEIQQLRVSDNGRFLVKEDGTPFFYLADTGWRIFEELTKEEADQYLETRKAQGFTVIMLDVEDSSETNAYGYVPYTNNDFDTPMVVEGPDNDFWDQADYVIDKAAELGLYVAIVPVWGNKYTGDDRKVDEGTARNVGRFFGERYADRKNIIWVMGGDIMPEGIEHIVRAMAEELTRAVTGSTGDPDHEILITYHPCGWYEADGYPHTSSSLHSEDWLDMNGIQSGHYDADEPPLLNYRYVEADYALTPAKPTSEMESLYEGIHFKNSLSYRKADDYDVRRNAYWSVFAGGYGYTFGNNNVWPFYDTSMVNTIYHTKYNADTNWYYSLYTPAADDMVYLKDLMMSRGSDGYLGRIPDQTLVASSNPDNIYHIQATRAADGSYAFIYIPEQEKTVTISTSKLSGGTIHVWWYNPRDGSYIDEGTMSKPSSQSFTTPTSSGPDWVLVLDEASAGYGPPGT